MEGENSFLVNGLYLCVARIYFCSFCFIWMYTMFVFFVFPSLPLSFPCQNLYPPKRRNDQYRLNAIKNVQFCSQSEKKSGGKRARTEMGIQLIRLFEWMAPDSLIKWQKQWLGSCWLDSFPLLLCFLFIFAKLTRMKVLIGNAAPLLSTRSQSGVTFHAKWVWRSVSKATVTRPYLRAYEFRQIVYFV